MKVFSFKKEANDVQVTLRMNQVTAVNLSRHFGLEITSIYLKERYGDALEFPNNTGIFELNTYNDQHDFIVYGTPGDESIAWNSPPQLQSSTPIRTQSRQALVIVKVVRADRGSNGKPYNQQAHNLTAHINVYSETEATVENIQTKVREQMSDDSLVLVNSGGMIYHGQEGTSGVRFWKVGSRKVFAIPNSQFSVLEEEPPAPKRRRSGNSSVSNSDQLENILDELGDIKGELKSFHQLAFKNKFSLSFLLELDNAFECVICKATPAKPPLIGCMACASVIGCQDCTNTWYAGNNGILKTCPRCRAERGLTKTFVMKGFTNLIEQINIMNNVNEGALDDTVPIVQESAD